MSALRCPIKTPPHPPKNFHPNRATDKELEKYSYPPRPDPSKAPIDYAEWETLAARNTIYSDAKIVERPIGGLGEARYWAGAVVHATPRGDPSSQQRFNQVYGEWQVPIITPSKKDGGSNKDKYRIWSWVGLDGWENKISLKIGVTSTIVETNDETHETHEAAILFQTETEFRPLAFEGFPVEAGEKIYATVWGNPTTTGPFHAAVAKKVPEGVLWAIGDLPSDLGVKLEGLTAQWVLAGRDPEAPPEHRFLLPNFQATEYSKLVAIRVSGREVGSGQGSTFDAQKLPISVQRSISNSLIFFNKLAEV